MYVPWEGWVGAPTLSPGAGDSVSPQPHGSRVDLQEEGTSRSQTSARTLRVAMHSCEPSLRELVKSKTEISLDIDSTRMGNQLSPGI